MRLIFAVGLVASALAAFFVAPTAMRLASAATATPTVTPTATGTPPVTPTPASLDLVALVQQQTAALNRGDIAAVMSLFGDNPTFEGGPCMPCVGRAAVQAEFAREIGLHIQVTLSGLSAAGNTVTGRYALFTDSIRAAGIDRIVGTDITVFANGKIASLRVPLDLSDPQTARYLALVRARARALRAPITGAGATGSSRRRQEIAFWIIAALFGAGALAGCSGLLARRAARQRPTP
jgi:ketosteroid isomerase-like protein